MAENNNINLNISTKKRFTIDGDRNRVIELDIHDISVVNRLSDSIKKLDALADEWKKLSEIEISEEGDSLLADITAFSEQFASIESQMRGIVDFIFDCDNLCDIILGKASIFSPVNGMFKYEQIIDVLTGLYEDTIKTEAKKINKRKVEAKTSKYIKKKK